MAKTLYYNPVTEEMEFVNNPSPLRENLGERFGFNEGGRIGFQRGTTLASQKSVDEYVNIIRNMIKDNKYVPTVNIDRREMGPIPNFQKAKEIVKAEVGESFDILYNRNIQKRKKIKRAKDPVKKEYDIMKKAERKSKRRALKVSDDIKLTAREADLNLDQRNITRKLNTVIKNNPNLILKNKALMETLSFTVSKDGDIIKIKPNLDDIKNRGIVEVEHQRDIFKKGKLKDFPYNRNLILGPYNREGGFKKTGETFIEKNPDPNNVKVKNIIKKAKELGVTLQPNVPKGTFLTKSIGYVQEGGPVQKFVNAAKKVFKKAPLILNQSKIYSKALGPLVLGSMYDDVLKQRTEGKSLAEALASQVFLGEAQKDWQERKYTEQHLTPAHVNLQNRIRILNQADKKRLTPMDIAMAAERDKEYTGSPHKYIEWLRNRVQDPDQQLLWKERSETIEEGMVAPPEKIEEAKQSYRDWKNFPPVQAVEELFRSDEEKAKELEDLLNV